MLLHDRRNEWMSNVSHELNMKTRARHQYTIQRSLYVLETPLDKIQHQFVTKCTKRCESQVQCQWGRPLADLLLRRRRRSDRSRLFGGSWSWNGASSWAWGYIIGGFWGHSVLFLFLHSREKSGSPHVISSIWLLSREAGSLVPQPDPPYVGSFSLSFVSVQGRECSNYVFDTIHTTALIIAEFTKLYSKYNSMNPLL